MGVFFRPDCGVCGDFIPTYHQEKGTFELYYLLDYRDIPKHGEGTPWRRVSTKDFVHFTEDGEMVSRGTPEEQDLFVFTGCVVNFDGEYHLYYTGHNHYLPERGGCGEAIMHAVSEDGDHWVKVPEDTFYAPDGEGIEKNDWRDPFVFWNEEENCYWMLLCTRKQTGPSRRRGATGYLTSTDLRHWEYQGSLWNPSLCWCPECPDIFRWGKYWYLIYSTFCESEGMRTYYRIAESPRGPWKNPGNNSLEGRAFYAGKTAADGKNRYIFGWNPTREGDRDSGIWQWGGNLVVHKLMQNPDGTLRVGMPETIPSCYPETQAFSLSKELGEAELSADGCLLRAPDGFSMVRLSGAPRNCMLSFDIRMEPGTDGAGVMLRAEEDLNSGYYLRLEPNRGKLTFDPEKRACDHADIERYVRLEPGATHHVTIILDDTVFLAYLDDSVALSARMYDIEGKEMAFFAFDGGAQITNVELRPYCEAKQN